SPGSRRGEENRASLRPSWEGVVCTTLWVTGSRLTKVTTVPTGISRRDGRNCRPSISTITSPTDSRAGPAACGDDSESTRTLQAAQVTPPINAAAVAASPKARPVLPVTTAYLPHGAA